MRSKKRALKKACKKRALQKVCARKKQALSKKHVLEKACTQKSVEKACARKSVHSEKRALKSLKSRYIWGPISLKRFQMAWKALEKINWIFPFGGPRIQGVCEWPTQEDKWWKKGDRVRVSGCVCVFPSLSSQSNSRRSSKKKDVWCSRLLWSHYKARKDKIEEPFFFDQTKGLSKTIGNRVPKQVLNGIQSQGVLF